LGVAERHHNNSAEQWERLMDNLKGKVPKQPWRSPALTYVGNVGDLLQGGTGKTNLSLLDMGDNRKPPGLEN
jgi:hypothetical protein